MTTEYPVKYIDHKKYYRVPQSQAITPDGGDGYRGDACEGCALRILRQDNDVPCPEHKDKKLHNNPVICQDYEYDRDTLDPTDLSKDVYHDYIVLKDFIFIPANRKGIAGYVAHLLESS